jgi:Phage protein
VTDAAFSAAAAPHISRTRTIVGMARQWIKAPAGVGAKELARACGVTQRTARRWTRAGQLPRVYQAAIATLEPHDLGQVSPDWSGFKVFRGELVTPEGMALRPGEIRSIPIRQQYTRNLELAVERLKMGLEPEQHELELEDID